MLQREFCCNSFLTQNYFDSNSSLSTLLGNSLYVHNVCRGGAMNFPTGGLTLPMKGLKYGFQSTINAKNLRKRSLFAFRRGAIAPQPSPGATPECLAQNQMNSNLLTFSELALTERC